MSFFVVCCIEPNLIHWFKSLKLFFLILLFVALYFLFLSFFFFNKKKVKVIEKKYKTMNDVLYTLDVEHVMLNQLKKSVVSFTWWYEEKNMKILFSKEKNSFCYEEQWVKWSIESWIKVCCYKILFLFDLDVLWQSS